MAEARLVDMLVKPLSIPSLPSRAPARTRGPSITKLHRGCQDHGLALDQNTCPPPIQAAAGESQTPEKRRRGRPRKLADGAGSERNAKEPHPLLPADVDTDNSVSPVLRAGPSDSGSERNDNEAHSQPLENDSCDTAPPVLRSRRGRTREVLGLSNANGAGDSTEPLKQVSSHSDFWEETVISNASSIASSSDGRSVVHEEASMASVNRKGFPPEPSEQSSKNNETESENIPGRRSQAFQKQMQDFINARIEKKHREMENDSEDDDYPLWVDEDDPYWLDEPDEGWGFRVSEFFKEKLEVKTVKEDNGDTDDDDDAPDIDWDLETEKWSAREIDSMMWTATVFEDPSPVVVLVFERYGKKARECYHVLRELEAAANQIWESHRLPPRLVKIDASVEIDLASALYAKELPLLLFIKCGKCIHRQSGYFTCDNLMRMIGYFYHGASRPSCLKAESIPQNSL